MDIDDPGGMTLDLFMMWRVDSLKLFLEKRGLSKERTKAELAALCFAANKMNLPVKLSCSELICHNVKMYSDMLKSFSIPDPLKLCEGWLSEKDGVCHWPPVYLSDITSFFISKDEKLITSGTNNYLNAYKAGKAYEYFSSNWLKEVFFHCVPRDSLYCILRASCTPSQRVADTDHSVWTCVEKASGRIMCAHCTCTAG